MKQFATHKSKLVCPYIMDSLFDMINDYYEKPKRPGGKYYFSFLVNHGYHGMLLEGMRKSVNTKMILKMIQEEEHWIFNDDNIIYFRK